MCVRSASYILDVHRCPHGRGNHGFRARLMHARRKGTAMRPVHITDTTLRDAHQSLWATRMEIGDMLPILPKMDSVGYWSLEVWGGATFDAALRFLDENPWERLRTIKQHCPNTPLQMLLAWAEPRRLPPLLRRDRQPVRVRVQAQRHRGLPCVRRAERHPQRRRRRPRRSRSAAASSRAQSPTP